MSFKNTYTDAIRLLNSLTIYLGEDNYLVRSNSSPRLLKDILDDCFSHLTNSTLPRQRSEPNNIDKTAWKNFILSAFGSKSTATFKSSQAADLAQFITRMTILFVHVNRAEFDLSLLTQCIANVCGQTNFDFKSALRINDALIILMHALTSQPGQTPTNSSKHLLSLTATGLVLASATNSPASSPEDSASIALETTSLATDAHPISIEAPTLHNDFASNPLKLAEGLLAMYKKWLPKTESETSTLTPYSLSVSHNSTLIAALFEALCFSLLAIPQDKRVAEYTYFYTIIPPFSNENTTKALLQALYIYYPHEHGALSNYLNKVLFPYDLQTFNETNLRDLLSKIDHDIQHPRWINPLPRLTDLEGITPLEAYLNFAGIHITQEASLSDLNVSAISIHPETPIRPVEHTTPISLTMSNRRRESTTAHGVEMQDVKKEPLIEPFTPAGTIQLARIIADMEGWCNAIAIELEFLEIFSLYYLGLMGAIWEMAMRKERATPEDPELVSTTIDNFSTASSTTQLTDHSILTQAQVNPDNLTTNSAPGLDFYLRLIYLDKYITALRELPDEAHKRIPLFQLLANLSKHFQTGQTINNYIVLLKIIAPILFFPEAYLDASTRAIFLALASNDAAKDADNNPIDPFIQLERLARFHPSTVTYLLQILTKLFPTVELPHIDEIYKLYLYATIPTEHPYFARDRSLAKKFSEPTGSLILALYEHPAPGERHLALKKGHNRILFPIVPTKATLHRIFELFNAIPATSTTRNDLNVLLTNFLERAPDFPANLPLTQRMEIFQAYLKFFKRYPLTVLAFYQGWQPTSHVNTIGIDGTNARTQLIGLRRMVSLFETQTRYISIWAMLLIAIAAALLGGGIGIVTWRLINDPNGNTALDQKEDIAVDCLLGINGLALILEIYRRANPSLQAMANLALLNNTKPNTNNFFGKLLLPIVIIWAMSNILYGCLLWQFKQIENSANPSPNMLFILAIAGIVNSLLSYFFDGMAVAGVLSLTHFSYINRPKKGLPSNANTPLLGEAYTHGGFALNGAELDDVAVQIQADPLLSNTNDLTTPAPISPLRRSNFLRPQNNEPRFDDADTNTRAVDDKKSHASVARTLTLEGIQSGSGAGTGLDSRHG